MFSFFKKPKVVVRHRPEHNISRKLISPEALKVLYRLSNSGYKAYLVGGGVRDILLGRSPKDFDVGTNAQPREIKHLFQRCFLVGRRFRLAHVVFGQTVIETSTFRKQPPLDEGEDGDLYQSDDNTFGTPEEDAQRRDFTVNGLFYDIKTFDVIDYVGGLRDLDRRVLRSIGDANLRFREDPVRMMRAIRLSCKLGLTIERSTRKALYAHGKEIAKASIPRVLEEIFRLFSFGGSEAAFRLLWDCGMMQELMPHLNEFINTHGKKKSKVWDCLAAYDSLTKDDPDAASNGLRVAVIYLAQYLDGFSALVDNQNRDVRLSYAEQIIRTMSIRYRLPRAAFYNATHLLEELSCFEKMPPSNRTIRESRADQFREAVLLARIRMMVYGDVSSQNIDAWASLRVIPNRERN